MIELGVYLNLVALVTFLVSNELNAQTWKKLMPFGDVRAGKRFSGSHLKTYFILSRNGCALKCNGHPKCRSFNSWSGGSVCELNENDVFSTTIGEELLEDSANCFYVGMRREEAPVCFHGEEIVDISNEEKGFCDVNEKRVDTQWGSWENITEDTTTDWKEIQRRKVLVEAAHGGKANLEGNDDIIFSWLKWVHETKPWHDAQAHCKNMKGTLFSKVDGTEEQLSFLTEKMGGGHWLGIHTANHDVWKTVEGQDIAREKLLWKPGQPDNSGNIEYYAMNAMGGNWGLNDLAGYRELFSVCDMII